MQSVQAGSLLMLGTLTIAMIQDIKLKKVSIWWIVIFYISVPAAVVLSGGPGVIQMTAGGVVGVVLIAVSIFTGQAVGLADGMIFLGLGVYLGLWNTIGVLFMALFMAAVVGVVAVLVKKADKKTRMPFLPFVEAAFVLMIWSVG